MSHGEAQIIREVSSVLTAAPLKRVCQLCSHCRENKKLNYNALAMYGMWLLADR